MIPDAYRNNMPQYMTIDISDRSVLYRHDLIMFDMLANANWERPLYMSMTVGERNYPAVLTKFFVHEGLAYRITPFNWNELGHSTPPVDVDKFYTNVMERFKWGGVKDNKDYYADETVRRMISTHRNLISQLATEMINGEHSDKRIIALLEKVYNEFPRDVIPYDALRDNTMALAGVYNIIYQMQCEYKNENSDKYLGDDTLKLLKSRINEISNIVLRDEYEHLRWYSTLDEKEHNDILIYHHLSLLKEAWTLLDNKLKIQATQEIVKVITDLLEIEIDYLEKTRSKNEEGIKNELVSNIYHLIMEFELTENEQKRIKSLFDRYVNSAQKRH
jgi:hypothetical protein